MDILYSIAYAVVPIIYVRDRIQRRRERRKSKTPCINPSIEQPKTPKTTDSKLFKKYAMLTKANYEPGNSMFMQKKPNQDRSIIIPILPHSCLFGVFDGHGPYGHIVSEYLLQHMPEWYENPQNKNWIQNPKQSLNDCFDWLTTCLENSHVNCILSGSTAVITCICENEIYIANLGDSRAVLAREESQDENGKLGLNAIALSIDQKPENPMEKLRIETANGRVEPYRDSKGNACGPYRVWLKNKHYPGLAMSRSFGDDIATSVGVYNIPEIITQQRTQNDKFIVIASDGIWEFITNQEAVEIVNKYKNPNKACQALCKEATKRWRYEEHCVDDITVIVVQF